MKSYLIPSSDHQVEQIVKRSQFICYVKHTPDKDAAHKFIDQIQEKHSDANHNCWAFIAGRPEDPSLWGMNDDGEPKGCAGKPMFNVLQHSGIGEICAVVTRYFGGIKLGTGGMARAYSSTVQLALESLSTSTKYHYESVTIKLPYNLLKTIEKVIVEHSGVTLSTDYSDVVTISADLRLDTFDEVINKFQALKHQGVQLSIKD